VALKRTGCRMLWKMVPQTTSHALFEMTTVCLNTTFESCSPLVNDRTRAMSQPAAVANRLFCILLGSTVTFLKWSGHICSQLVSNFLRSLCTKNYWNRFIFDRVIPKIKKWDVFLGHSVYYDSVKSLPIHWTDALLVFIVTHLQFQYKTLLKNDCKRQLLMLFAWWILTVLRHSRRRRRRAHGLCCQLFHREC